MRNILIVGAGIFGSVLAERFAEDAGRSVTVIDRRGHIGGNCWSETDPETGVEYHKYGSHIFHTSDEAVRRYITRFTAFNEYRHTVWTVSNDKVYSMPMNLGTINAFYGKNLSPGEAAEFIRIEAAKERCETPSNLEEHALASIGRPLYEAFIRGYTAKQWEKDPRELPASTIARLPVRYNYNNRYFSDKYEGIPLDGYGKVFERMLDHPRITVRLNTEYADVRGEFGASDHIWYTGAMDEFFGYSLGRLEWRTVDLHYERPECPDFQGTSVMNYADQSIPWTRIHEYKHYHPERPDTGKTIIAKEYPRFAGQADEPFYPVETRENRDLLQRYRELANETAPNVTFCGRLGSYTYYDMDDAIAAALECFTKKKNDL